MAPAEELILRFRCVTASPFHTARQEYANLIKCAPFILGTTLRGAALNYLIRAHCPEATLKQLEGLNDPAAIVQVHRACSADCPAKVFYLEPPVVRFSFGLFPGEPALARTRIALERETASVAEGAIVSVEAMPPGTGFEFEVILLAGVARFAAEIEAAVEEVGRSWGIGRLRSIGFGLYEIAQKERIALGQRLEAAQKAAPDSLGEDLRLKFTTPYVLGNGVEAVQIDGEQLARKVEAELAAGGEPPLRLARVEAQIQPDFVSRFSFERGLRENYLVAWQESQLTLKLAEAPRPHWKEALARAQVFGLGQLNEVGFGRFEFELPKRENLSTDIPD